MWTSHNKKVDPRGTDQGNAFPLVSRATYKYNNSNSITTRFPFTDRKYTAGQRSMPITIFFCYAREDETLLNKLKTHLRPLQRQGLISI
jgi:hypothetical protein